MADIKDYKFWFVTGSQFLYGPEVLKQVEEDSKKIIEKLNESGNLPYPIEFKTVGVTAENITEAMKEANMMTLLLVLSHGHIHFHQLKTGFVARNCSTNHCSIWQPKC